MHENKYDGAKDPKCEVRTALDPKSIGPNKPRPEETSPTRFVRGQPTNSPA